MSDILHHYSPYGWPKFGVFGMTGNDYGPNGWEIMPQRHTIIGETADTYVTHLVTTVQEEWVGNKIVETKMVLPIGIHKSRLQRWEAGQLMFDLV